VIIDPRIFATLWTRRSFNVTISFEGVSFQLEVIPEDDLSRKGVFEPAPLSMSIYACGHMMPLCWLDVIEVYNLMIGEDTRDRITGLEEDIAEILNDWCGISSGSDVLTRRLLDGLMAEIIAVATQAPWPSSLYTSPCSHQHLKPRTIATVPINGAPLIEQPASLVLSSASWPAT
jgi:hypothetical protein